MYLFITFVGLCGFAFIAVQVRNIRLAKASVNWPHVEGKVVKSKWRINQWSKKGEGYTEVVYEYLVEGTLRHSDRIAFGTGEFGMPKDQARIIKARYPQDAQVTVYYNPNKPRVAVLEPGNSEGAVSKIVAAVIVFGLIVGIIVLV